MFLRRLAVAVVLGTVAAGPGSAAPAAGTAEVVRGLQAWLDGTRTLESRFRQSLVSGVLGASTIETGRLYLERPGKLRWDYLDPERKVALLIGRRTELYLDDERQLTRGVLSEEEGAFPKLLAGDGRLADLFVATLVAAPQGPGIRLKLTPKGEAGALSEVVLTLHPGDFAIEAADVLDELGNRTTYGFYGMKRNAKLPTGIFAFEPPAGTEIVAAP